MHYANTLNFLDYALKMLHLNILPEYTFTYVKMHIMYCKEVSLSFRVFKYNRYWPAWHFHLKFNNAAQSHSTKSYKELQLTKP